MMVLSKVLKNAVAGVVVIAGVGSLFALGIMYGVEAAYAETERGVLDSNDQRQFVFMLEDQRHTLDLN